MNHPADNTKTSTNITSKVVVGVGVDDEYDATFASGATAKGYTKFSTSNSTNTADADTSADDVTATTPAAALPFCFRRGTDARAVTCRAKLQTKRCKLNQEINKELRLRAGAENLYKATINRKMKDTIALELSFVNSNLQLLKEKLSELNSSVEIYQHER